MHEGTNMYIQSRYPEKFKTTVWELHVCDIVDNPG